MKTKEKIELLIKQHKQYMANQELADDFYYTNGRRKNDLKKLDLLKELLRRTIEW